MAKPVSFRWDEGFVARIDEARKTGVGEVSRSAFVRRAVERALGPGAGLGRVERGYAEAVKGANVAPVSPAPAEQPEMDGVPFTDPSDRLRETRRVSPSGPASPRVPFRRDVKPFQRGS